MLRSTPENRKVERRKHAVLKIWADTKILDPSENSQLMKATQDGWKWFKAGELPSGNLFRCNCGGSAE